MLYFPQVFFSIVFAFVLSFCVVDLAPPHDHRPSPQSKPPINGHHHHGHNSTQTQFSTTISASNCPTASPPGLVDYWQFDDGSLIDSINSSVSLSCTNVISTQDENGSNNAALLFTSSASCQFPSHQYFYTSEFTIAIWLRPSVSNSFGVLSFTSQNSFFLIANADSSLKLAIVGSGNGALVKSTIALPLNYWSNFAVAYSNNIANIYVNGSSAGSGSFTGPFCEASLGNGASVIGSGGFSGSIDDLRIYNYALTQNELESFLKN